MMSSNKPSLLPFAGLLLLLSSVIVNTASAEHACACEAKELNFKIDCDIGDVDSHRDIVLAALEALRTDKCSENCDSPECTKNFYIVQSHHDYCPEEVIPQSIEDDFHNYDAICKHCKINRKATANAEECPTVNCDDKSGDAAYGALSNVKPNCFDDCNNHECKNPYLYLKTVHDVCDHDTLEQASEEGLHDWEKPCHMHVCNVPGAEDSQLVCNEDGGGDGHDGHDHGHDKEHGEEEAEEHSDDNKEPAAVPAANSAGSLSLATASLLSVAIGLLAV